MTVIRENLGVYRITPKAIAGTYGSKDAAIKAALELAIEHRGPVDVSVVIGVVSHKVEYEDVG